MELHQKTELLTWASLGALPLSSLPWSFNLLGNQQGAKATTWMAPFGGQKSIVVLAFS